MAKKKVKDPNPATIDLEKDEFTPEQYEQARQETRKDFNERFSKWIEIDPVNATDEDLQQAKKEFDEQVEYYQKQTYKLAGHEDGLALKTAEFLKNWNANFNTWTNTSWRGLIRFDHVIDDHIKELSADSEKDFNIAYSTLIFLYQAMSNPGGVGIESARTMAKLENYNEETDAPYEENIPVTYSGILQEVQHHVSVLGLIDKKLAIYQERVRLAAAGLKMNLKISELEEFKEFHEAWTVSTVPTNPKELNEYVNGDSANK